MQTKIIIDTDNAPRSFGPYSQGVIFNHLLFTSSILPIELDSGRMSRARFRDQVELVLNYLNELVTASGVSMAHVIKTTIYLKNLDDLELLEPIYRKHFDYAPPSRSVVEVARLQDDALIAIEAVVAIPPQKIVAEELVTEEVDTKALNRSAFETSNESSTTDSDTQTEDQPEES